MSAPTILHVEDEPDDALLVRIAFKKAQVECRIHRASDGQGAVDYLSGIDSFADRDANPKPTLMLLDLKLPLLDGFEVLAWARGQPSYKDLPIVVLSSSSLEEDRGKALSLGANSYFVKSWSYSELVKHVAAVLSARDVSAAKV